MYVYLVRDQDFFELVCNNSSVTTRSGGIEEPGISQTHTGFDSYEEAFEVLIQQTRELTDEGFVLRDPEWWLAIAENEELLHRLGGITERILDGQLERDEVDELVGEVLDDVDDLPAATRAFADLDRVRFHDAVGSQVWIMALANALAQEDEPLLDA